MKTAMISTSIEVANNSSCPTLILEMATFRLEVRKSIDVIFFFFPFKFTDSLLLHRSLPFADPGPQMKKIME